ncbi:threonine/serine exporter family protein [Leptolyngbya sp. FACHB-261]|uniref:threonine/serine exporter family protein n=1 Tax=Leptolyngbya sp. FACHB-261 TaxID=2692806 RepID=UPI0016825627|nr:threonine/serine exporter family protein [Leptolyngbya sp. FACHB-261]MBD2101808.1 threonine/serine exporter family protein [Leptolyngbya sp. FACHB-261]
MDPEASSLELAKTLRAVLRLGVLMLRGGSSSFRVEQAMSRSAQAMGVERLDAYVTPTGIIASAYQAQAHQTQIARVRGLGVDMNRISILEFLALHMPPAFEPELLETMLDNVEQLPPVYPPVVLIPAVAIACGVFAIIQGGSWLEFAAAASGAGAAQSVRLRLQAAKFNPIPITVVCAAIATAISYPLVLALGLLATKLGLGAVVPRLAVISSVLLLVPGMPLVTAMLDLTRLDLVSGVTRFVYALLLLISIGIGILLVLGWTGFTIV